MSRSTRPELPPLPPIYLPRDIAKALHCSEWWVKEQARRGRIPFSKPGGSYRFTAEHFAEIMRIFESRPTESSNAAAPAASAPRPRAATAPAPVTRLKARTPRRALRSQSQSNAA
ncbi:DNA-binding protein [Streptomyces sp. NPDC005708]|uniref:DNA-binding protein n=1 Tax=Streptomyces sp. NPDC005708 TaxID=3154564 RepID=UPI0033F266BF